MATTFGEMYKHIKSMRGCDKPSSYEEIKVFLLDKGFDTIDVDHAITYARRKEHDENERLKSEGSWFGNINGLITAWALMAVGVLSLVGAVYFTVKIFDVVAAEKEYVFYINWQLDTNYSYTTDLKVRLIVAAIITALISAVLIPIGINYLRKQKEFRRLYIEKKRKGQLHI